MKKKVSHSRKQGKGYIVEIQESFFKLWKFNFTRKKVYYLNDLGYFYYPSYSVVLDSEEKNFLSHIFSRLKKR